MGKKKKRKSVAKPKDPFDLLAALSQKEGAAANRINEVIQRVSKPETVLEHIQRTGAQYWVCPTGLDAQGNSIGRPCLVVPWDDLIRSELEHLRAGGQFGDVLGKNTPKQVTQPKMDMADVIQNFGKMGESIKKAAPAMKKITDALAAARQNDGMNPETLATIKEHNSRVGLNFPDDSDDDYLKGMQG